MLIPAVRSIATYVGVSLYVLIVAPPGMLLAILFGWKDVLYVLGHVGVRLGLALSGIRVRVAGAQNVPHDRAAVFCSNHQSNVDPPILFDALHPRMHILYKAEIDAIRRAIETGAASIRTGNSFLIFPEGTRSRTADLLPFKKGGFVMALKAQAPIVPVAVQGGRAAMRKGSSIIRPVTVSIRVGEPIETAGLALENRDALITRTRQRIEALLAEGPI